MKRFSKILVAVLALCLLVGVLALAISANSGIDGKFVVKGVGYETWEDAVAAANNTHTIYLNEDWTLDTGKTISGETTNVKLNLNGKTVSVTDGTMLFNVHTSAKLTIEGSGTLNNSGAVLIGGSASAEVTVNATGAGIVINNTLADATADVNTFRFQSRAILNVSGKIVVNTNGVTKNRAIFNVADSGKKTVTLNIKDADVLYATPSVTGAPAGKVIYSQFSDVNVDDSRLEGVYCYVIYAATTGSVDLSGYIIDKDETEAVSYGWDSTKLAEIKAIEIPITETYSVNDSVIASTKATGYEGNISGSMMYFGGATEAHFTNCVIYGHYRSIYGKQSNGSWDAANIPTKTTDASQLTFNNCHIRACEGGSIAYLVCYGPNAKFIGGSISGVSSFANCQPHYVELDNGQWIGVYVDNVLGVSGLPGDNQVITTAWQNTAKINPASTINGTLPQSVTILVDGKSSTFTNGCFSDEDLYNSYLPVVEEKHVWDDYIVQMSNANVVGGSFLKDGANAAVGTNPLGTAYTFGTTNGTSSYVYDSKGNGYIKHYMAGGSGSQPSSSNYQQIVTGSASFATTDAYVWEWDVSTDDAQYLKVSFTAQGRELKPRFNASGTYIGDAARAYLNQPGGINITASNTFTFNGGSANLPTTKGEWSRITIVVDIVRGELTEIDVPAYSDVNTPIEGVTVKKNAYSILGSKVYAYVDGVLVGSAQDFGSTSWGYNGYIIQGYESKYYFDQIRISPSAATADGSYCVDNVRTSAYPIGSGVDLGLYNQDGSVKTDINGLPHFLVMPNNNTTVFVEQYVANVDGVNYKTESEAIAAIKAGSTVELLADFESYIPANVAFKLITNEYTVPGFVSATHKVVDCVAGMGYYDIVAASADEIFTINYTFGGKTETQTVAMGTVVPAMTETFPTTIEGNIVTFVESWTLPSNISDYALTSNVINATAVTATKSVVAMAGGVGYESLEAAIAGANGETIVLQDSVTVDEMIYIDGLNVVIDLNGQTVTAGEAATTIFNVRYGSNFTLKGKGTINNALTVIGSSNMGVEGTTVNVNADAASDSTGIVINHRTIEDGADTDTAISTFRIHDSATLNVSGLITVNAYNGMRVVFNVYAGSGTVAAKALNISRAKVVVPLLGRTPENTTPEGYSQVISAGDGTAININDSELYALYGQLFHINGASPTKNVSSYMNADFTWLDSAASSINIDAATVTINAKNSRFFSEFGSYSQEMHAQGHNPGASFMSLAAKLDATFEDCTITTDWRGVTDSSGISGKKINNNQLLFLNCDFVTAPKTGETANAAPQFFMYGCNYKIIGGTWAHGAMSAGSNYYLELTDAGGNPTGQWVGGYMDGVLVDTAKTHKYSGVSGNWDDSTYVERDAISCNVTRVTDGVARTFKAAYFSDISDYLESVKAYEGLAYFYNTGDEATPFSNVSFSAGNGTIDKTLGYVKHYFSGAAAVSGYHNFDGNPGAVSYATTGAYIWEFDVSTDNGYFATSDIGVEGRDRHAIFDEDGSYLGYANSAGTMSSLNYEATYSLTIAGDTAKFNGKSVKLSTEKGDWTRITIIFDLVFGEERTESVPAYSVSGSTASVVEGKTVDIQVVDVTGTTMSVYVDGVLLSSYNPITTADYYGGALAKDYLANGYIDDVRIKNKATQESSICYDNIVFMPITNAISSEELGLVDNNGQPVASLEGSLVCGTLPENGEVVATPVVRVDGVDYTSVAAANAAIKENSIVELLADIDEAIEINYAGVKFVNTNYSFKGFVSSVYKFEDYTAARNAKYSIPADASEIFTITYSEYNGVTGSQTAVLGTVLKAPAEYDAVSKILNEAEKEYQTLLGWSLSNSEDVQVVTGNGVAYPVVDAVGAVVVYWTDANSEVLDTDFYFPGANTVLDEFDGTDIAVDHTPDYYGIKRIGWAGIDEATEGLATSGEYTITAVMGKVAPDTFPGLQYNLSLYSNYVLNIYVPQEIDGVSNVTVSTVEDGSIMFSQFESGTIGGVEYDKFGYMLGIADTNVATYYVVYYVDEQMISFPVTVGVPTYADIVMGMYADDTSAKGEATKTLIVNMANYALKVLEVSDSDMNSEGAQIYADIVSEYGAQYLTYYAGLTNDRFLAEGDLYAKHGVADLNWTTKTGANEGETEALGYVEAIGFEFNTFEPVFYLKLSDAAVNTTYGLQKPSSSGSTGYYNTGLHVYAGYYGQIATKMWAEKNGTKYYGGADIWLENSSTEYDYYVSATNNAWNTLGANAARQNWFKVSNITANVTFRFYENRSDIVDAAEVRVIGDVNYNLAAYVNSMLSDAVANAEYIEAAKALYAFSYASGLYKQTK